MMAVIFSGFSHLGLEPISTEVSKSFIIEFNREHDWSLTPYLLLQNVIHGLGVFDLASMCWLTHVLVTKAYRELWYTGIPINWFAL